MGAMPGDGEEGRHGGRHGFEARGVFSFLEALLKEWAKLAIVENR